MSHIDKGEFMNLLQITNLSKTYGDKMIFDQAAININAGDKIGIIGINGAGKTTLLKIIAGLETADAQETIRANGIHIEYLDQNLELNPELTVIEQVFNSESKIVKLVGEYESVVERLEKNPTDTALQNQMVDLTNQMDLMDGWGLESEAKKILTKLNIRDFDQKIGALSGGMKKRVALAGALIRPSDILILDEPTNHIDNDTIDFLEGIIQGLKTAVVMVTHDRYFLDRVMNTIVELKDARLHRYTGNYTQYLEIKAQREFDENVIEEKRQKLYKSELEWIRKGVEARRTKQKARKERFYQLEESLDNQQESVLNINLAQERLGRKIIEANRISKAYGDKVLFKDFTYALQKTDRIGIIGENGAGKTTLLNILSNKVQPDTGNVEIGDTVKICYYTQENEEADPDLKVIDYIKNEAEYVATADGRKISAGQMLENFLFTPKAQHTQIGRISGGERRRLYLLKLLMHGNNVLFLDEPTNDLDIETLGILEDYIYSYDGPVVTVSHDRYFLDKICNKIFLVENGEIHYFMGNYEDYKEQAQEALQEENTKQGKQRQVHTGGQGDKKQTRQPQEAPSKKQSSEDQKSGTGRKKLSFNQQRELDALPSEIQALEEQLSATEAALAQASTDFIQLQKLTEEKEMIELDLLEKMEKLEIYEQMS